MRTTQVDETNKKKNKNINKFDESRIKGKHKHYDIITLRSYDVKTRIYIN